MPAQSQQQQKLFGLALAVKRGEVPASEVSDEVRDIVDRMSEKDIEDFAGTSHKGLPKKVEQQIREMVREIMRERVIAELELSKDDMDTLHSDGEVEVDGEKVTFEESLKEATKPSIKMVNKFEPKEGIQIMAVKTLDGKTHFGGMVQRGKFARIIPFVPNQSKSDVQKRALQIFDELGKDESVKETIEPQTKKIASLTGTRPDAVKQFVSSNALNITKLLKFIEKGKLSDRMDFVTALAGKPGNPIQKKMIKMFNESINEGYSTEEKRIVMMAVKKIAKYMNVDIKTAMGYVLGAGQELERDIKKGKIK